MRRKEEEEVQKEKGRFREKRQQHIEMGKSIYKEEYKINRSLKEP